MGDCGCLLENCSVNVEYVFDSGGGFFSKKFELFSPVFSPRELVVEDVVISNDKF